MTTIPNWQPGVGGGTELKVELLNQPYHVGAPNHVPTYDLGTDTITVPIGVGRHRPAPGVTVEHTVDQQLLITPVTINTEYFVFVEADGSFTYSSVSDEESDGQVVVCSVATGATKDDLTVTDLRGMLPIPPPAMPHIEAHLVPAATTSVTWAAAFASAPVVVMTPLINWSNEVNGHVLSRSTTGASVYTGADAGATQSADKSVIAMEAT